MKHAYFGAALALATLSTACGGDELDIQADSTALGTGFTRDEVDAIVSELRRLDADTYRVQLPVQTLRGIDQQTFGRLPMRSVERIASQQRVRLERDANIIAVYHTCDGQGAGSHTPSNSAATGVGDRIERVLSNVDTDLYQFLR